MIDSATEKVRSLTRAAKEYPFPVRRGGKRVNVSTLYRWSLSGVRGVRLETIQVGGTRCTSFEALQRFFDRLTAASSTGGFSSPIQRTPHRRQLAAERASKELEKLGY